MKDLAKSYIGSEHVCKGSELCAEDRKHVLAAYVHRYTRNHIPAWAEKEWKNGERYPAQFNSDSEWLENSWFGLRKDGRLDRKKHFCFSSPTWPLNPELRKGGAK